MMATATKRRSAIAAPEKCAGGIVLMVPNQDDGYWPTLGPQVCDFMETYLVFGPGDLLGQPYKLSPEKRAYVYRLYEVYPKGHDMAGRRRFKRGGLSLRKGVAKTEFAAALTAVELHPDGPVRCDGWSGNQPIGAPVVDPYIPMVAYTEEQSDELAYNALKTMLEEGPLADDFDIGIERIMRKSGHGKAESLATSPNARDGARTTFQVFDETHRMVLPAQKRAHQTMLANIPKRKAADAWTLEVTTAYSPGEGSVAENTMDYARQVASGKIEESQLFFFHRQSCESHDLSTKEGFRAAVLDASGADAGWSDVDGIVGLLQDPHADRSYLERVYANRPIRQSDRAFDINRWNKLRDKTGKKEAPDGALIVLGFDGARTRDATALVATEVMTGFQWLVGLWERPEGIEQWEVPMAMVNAAVDACFERWQVWRLYGDPAKWETQMAEWANKYGHECIVAWPTAALKKTALAIQAYTNAIRAGELVHAGQEALTRHLGNAVRSLLNFVDDAGQRLYLLQKERPDSPFKIDGAYAGFLSWQCRLDALAAGVTGKEWEFGAV